MSRLPAFAGALTLSAWLVGAELTGSANAVELAEHPFRSGLAVAPARAPRADPASLPKGEFPPPVPSAGPATPAAANAPQARLDPLPGPRVAWRFQAAAPVSAAPAVGRDGAVYLTSTEGYLHALAPDGAHRWSYGLAGVPIGEPALDPAGRVYVATSRRRVYAMGPDGALKWEHRSPSRPASAAVWGAAGEVYFAGRDRVLYALSSGGVLLWRRSLEQGAVVAPASLPAGGLAVGTEHPELWLFRGAARDDRLALPSPLTQPVLSNGSRHFLVLRGELIALDARNPSNVAWRVPARQAALSPDGEWLVVERERALAWLSARSGQRVEETWLPEEPSAPAALSNAGVVLVPLVSGEVLLLGPGSAAQARVRIGAVPLWRPIWDERRQRALLAAGNGVVAALELAAWPALDELRWRRDQVERAARANVVSPLSEPAAAPRREKGGA